MPPTMPAPLGLGKWCLVAVLPGTGFARPVLLVEQARPFVGPAIRAGKVKIGIGDADGALFGLLGRRHDGRGDERGSGQRQS
jgi:hypothetical protein